MQALKSKNVMSIDFTGVIGDSELSHRRANFISPDVLDEINNRLLRNIELLRKKLRDTAEEEARQIRELQAAIRGIKDVIRLVLNPPPPGAAAAQIGERTAALPMIGDDQNEHDKLRRQIMTNPELSE